MHWAVVQRFFIIIIFLCIKLGHHCLYHFCQVLLLLLQATRPIKLKVVSHLSDEGNHIDSGQHGVQREKVAKEVAHLLLLAGGVQLHVDAIEHIIAGQQLEDALAKGRVVVVLESVPVAQQALLEELTSSR